MSKAYFRMTTEAAPVAKGEVQCLGWNMPHHIDRISSPERHQPLQRIKTMFESEAVK